MKSAVLAGSLLLCPAVAFAQSFSPGFSAALHSPVMTAAGSVRTPQEIRESYKKVVLQAHPRNNPDPYQLAPKLLAVYWELMDPRSLPAGERARKKRALKAKLEDVRNKLALARVRANREIQRAKRRAARSGDETDTAGTASAAGGAAAVAASATALINLIQNTIQPESWQVNGGLGTISFFGNPLYVLVIRNTGDVHHQIGGVLPGVR